MNTNKTKDLKLKKQEYEMYKKELISLLDKVPPQNIPYFIKASKYLVDCFTDSFSEED